MMILGRIFRSIHQATRFTGTFRVKNCEGVVIFGSPRTIFGSGSKSWLRRTVSQNVKISYFLQSILPKSERIKRVLFSGYGKFPKSGSKFQSVTINVFYVYIYNICHYYYDLNEARGQNQCARMSTQPCCDVPLITHVRCAWLGCWSIWHWRIKRNIKWFALGYMSSSRILPANIST